MFAKRSRSLLFASLMCMLATLPVTTFAEPVTSDEQTITIRDSRTGTGPCGFVIRRDVEGIVVVTPSIDSTGNLVLSIAPVELRGILANPANGKSVELHWIRQNGKAEFEADGETTAVALALTGHFFRGYDNARTDLEMALPADDVEIVAFEAGVRSEDPWTHICGLLV